jgi:hypothetical protein
VKVTGASSVTEALAGEEVPPVGEQATETVAEALGLSGTKSLWTTKVWLFWVLVIVQEGVPPFVMDTLVLQPLAV